MTGLKHLMSLQSCENAIGWCTLQCEMLLFCVKNIMRESCNFELAHLKKKKEKKRRERKTFWPSGDFLVFGTFVMLFRVTRHVIGHEAFKNDW